MKNTFRCIISMIVIAIIFEMMPLYVFAESADTEPIVYYGDQLPAVLGRTKEIIGQHYSQARNAGGSYINGDSTTYYSEQPSLKAPYAYGNLTDDTHVSMTAMTNYYRWLVGVEPLKTTSSNRDDLQAGALVRNWQFDHSISSDNKPSDMDSELWSFGAKASHNILASGYTPRGAITGWLNEGYILNSQSWNTIGHRTALISSYVGGLQYGYAGSIAIGDITDYTNTWSAPFAAFPAAGYAPMNDISANASAWSVELNSDKIEITDVENVTVKVTNLSDNSSYICTKSNGKLTGGSTLAFVQPAPKEGSYKYEEGQSYKVEITGLRDVATNREAKIIYTTEFFDVTKYADTYVTGFNINGWDELHITNKLNDTENLKKISSILPTTVNITTENGRSVTAEVSGKWQLDQENNRFLNGVDLSSLPDGVTDSTGVLQEISLAFVVDNYTGNFGIAEGVPELGKSGGFRMWRYNISTDRAEVYQVTGDSSEGYTAKLRYDKNSEGFSILENGYYSYDIDKWALSDNGDWFGLYYSSSEYFNEAYIAGAVNVNFPKASVVGDVNSDGKVNGKDSTLLMQYLADWDVEVDQSAADLNSDGKINGKDSTLLMQHLAGWDVEIG